MNAARPPVTTDCTQISQDQALFCIGQVAVRGCVSLWIAYHKPMQADIPSRWELSEAPLWPTTMSPITCLPASRR